MTIRVDGLRHSGYKKMKTPTRINNYLAGVLSNLLSFLDHKEKLHSDALPQAHELFHLKITEIRDLALGVTNSLRRIRSVMTKDGGSTLFTKEHICEVLSNERLSYKHINEILTTSKLDEMEISR